jgi:hypothetical protein
MNKKALESHIYNTDGYNSKQIAYAMLASGLFMNCECAVVNNDPQEFDEEYVFPRDMYVGDAITEKDIGTYLDFLKALGNNLDAILHCTCSLDETDNERISFVSAGPCEGIINFTTFDDSNHNPKELFKKLINKYKKNTT